MSLINNALKKAQREREGNRPDFSKLPATVPKPGNPASRTSFKLMRWIIAGILFSAGFGAAVAFMLTLLQKRDPVPVAQQAPHEIEVSIRTKPRPEPVPLPATPVKDATAPVMETTEPASPPAPALTTEETPPPAVPIAQDSEDSFLEIPESVPESMPIANPDKPDTPIEPIATEVPAEVKPETPAPLRTIAEQPVSASRSETGSNPAVIRFLEDAKITGIKVAGVHSRVLMNNQVFRVGSVVEPTTRLTITNILENEIHFTDESGLQYRKQF